MSGTRKIYKGAVTSQHAVREVLTMVFAQELLAPSKEVFIVAPWISNIVVFDSQIGQYATLNPEWAKREVLTAAAPLVQPRVRLLGEVAGMVGSLLSTEGYIEPDADAKKQLKDSAPAVLDAAIAALNAVAEGDWKTDFLHETLNKALVEDGGYKPRLAFGPVRVAMSGRRVSPPLFESMEIVGKDVAMARLKGLREHL